VKRAIVIFPKGVSCIDRALYCSGPQRQVVGGDTNPVKRFEASLQHDRSQKTLCPGVLELSTDVFDTLARHAVPLDYRAISALRHSALALDVYTWLAHRLCRIDKAQGVTLSW
jgi:Plasmid encoded RepA protein